MFFLLLLLFSIGCVQLHRISRSHMQQEPKTLTFYLLLRFWLGLCSGKFFVRPLVIFFTPVGDCIYSWWLYILGDCIFLVIVYILVDCIYSAEPTGCSRGRRGSCSGGSGKKSPRRRLAIARSPSLRLAASFRCSTSTSLAALFHLSRAVETSL